ncbi:MAG: N-acetylglucosamine kinase [Vicinamibacterales bacterium]
MYVLGIDAGGTKTVCLLADERGAILAEARGGGANLQAHGELEVEKVLHHVMDTALGDRDVRPAAICLGIAGVDRPHDADAIRGIMRRIGSKARTLVVNDALVALVAGAGEAPGIVIIAGTGSIAYGRNGAGHAARAGGWGYLLGDEGSGFWIGRRALSAVVRAADGRGPATELTGRVMTHLRLVRPSDLVHETYYRDLKRGAIAGLAPVVDQAREAGDAVASEILAQAAIELTAAASSVVTRLAMRGEAFPTILAGGIFKAVPWLAGDVMRRLLEVAPRSQAGVLDLEPAVGAVRLALAEARGGATIPVYV